MKKLIKDILLCIYLVIAIIITVLLLSYNDYKVTEIGNYTLLLVRDSSLKPEFNKGDLVIVNKDDEVLNGEKAFFYEIYDQKVEIKLAEIEGVEDPNAREKAYILEGDRKISEEYMIGKSSTAQVVPNLGTILGILESKWGFLFIIVCPALILVVNQIGIVFSNIKQATKEENKKEKQPAESESETSK